MNAEAPVILQIKNLTKKFAAEGGKMLTAGQTLGIIGESGCGKSTLVRTILQIHPASGGEVIFDGQDILKLRGEAARQNRRKIQMVFQDPAAAFNPKMKVKEIVCEPLLNFGLIKKSEVDAKAAELLRMVELPEDFKDRYPHNMSGGQRQRLGIARAVWALRARFRWNQRLWCATKLQARLTFRCRKKSASFWYVCRKKRVLPTFLSAMIWGLLI